MPRILPWLLVDQFQGVNDYEKYKKNTHTFSVTKSNYTNSCFICKTSHRMRIVYSDCVDRKCNSKGKICTARTKVIICLKHSNTNEQTHLLYKLNEHLSQEFSQTMRGITPVVKKLIENLMYRFDAKPNRIYNLLKKKRFAKHVDKFPTLKQIQTYFQTRRDQIGDNNDIIELKNYVDKLGYIDGDTSPHKLFTFGNSLVECDEENSFYLGFTSLALLRRAENFKNIGTFHIDCTYKIVKYCYPLIIFGFTDIQRKFFPIAYMFTSRERELDFNHFFSSLLSVFNMFSINIQPTYIVIDASYALANSIKTMFPKAIILMCWFHLKQNVRKHKSLIDSERYLETIQDINLLHNSLSSNAFQVIFFKNFKY